MPLTPKGNSKSHLGHMKASASSNLKEKLKTMALDSHSAFSRHPPYSHPLNSGISSSSQRSGSHTTDTSSTKAISSGNLLLKKIEDLDKETDIFADEVDDSHTHCATLQYNYTLWSKELDLQHEEHSAQVVNAEAVFCCEHDLKILNLKMKKVKDMLKVMWPDRELNPRPLYMVKGTWLTWGGLTQVLAWELVRWGAEITPLNRTIWSLSKLNYYTY